MSLFSDNIRALRIKNNISQQKLAEILLITRGRYVKYEDGSSEPPYDILQKIAAYHRISIDLLLSVDVRKINIDDLLKLDNNRLLLPIIVDSNGKNFVELIPYKARAGYATGLGDPRYIEELPQYQMPFLGAGKHRIFPVEGDSMPPHEDGSYIVTRYIEKLDEIVNGKTYIVITRDEGIVYKRINKNGENILILESDNSFYEPYTIKASDILEIWEFEYSIGKNDKKPYLADKESLEEIIRKLQKDMADIKANFT
jgi:transcriptional regulator with XRE-family HTH domain